MKIKYPISYELIPYESHEISNGLSKVKIRVFHLGENINGSNIASEAVARQMMSTTRGTPIAGFYDEKIEDFLEHNMDNLSGYRIYNGELYFQHAAVPIGFIPLDAEIWTEDIIEENGEVRKYYCTEGRLWTQRYPYIERIIEQGNGQSFELDSRTIRYTPYVNDIGREILKIEYADIVGLCILGEGVKPCFPSASAYAYSSNAPEAWTEFNIKFAECLRDIEEEKTSQDDGAEPQNIEGQNPNNDEGNTIIIYTRNMVSNLNKGGYGMKEKIQYELESNSKECLVFKALNPYNAETQTYDLQYTVQKIEENSAIVYSLKDGKHCRVAFSMDESSLVAENPVEINVQEVDEAEKQSIEQELSELKEFKESAEGKELVDATTYAEMQEKIAETEGKVLVEQAEYDSLKEESEKVEGLEAKVVEYTATVEKYETEKKDSLITQFAAILSKEKVDIITASAKTLNYDDLEKELSLAAFKEGVTFNQVQNNNPSPNVGTITYGAAKPISNLDGDLAWVAAVHNRQNKNNGEANL